jgi:hypothetical protein
MCCVLAATLNGEMSLKERFELQVTQRSDFDVFKTAILKADCPLPSSALVDCGASLTLNDTPFPVGDTQFILQDVFLKNTLSLKKN